MELQVIVTDDAGAQRLETPSGLPTISVPRGVHATADVIVNAVHEQLGIRVALVRVPGHDTVEVEWRDDPSALPPGAAWHPHCLRPPGTSRNAWQRPGWLSSVLAEADAALQRRSLTRTGQPTQVRHTSVTGMLKIPVNGSSVWLKALPSIFAHEAPVIEWLSRIAPSSVPRVIAREREWWIADCFPAEIETDDGAFALEMSKLQLAAIPHVSQLRALGCPDRRIGTLTRAIDRLAQRADLLDAAERSALRDVVPVLRRVCLAVDQLGVPATLVHGDLHPENAVRSDSGWLIYDWTDACVAHPFVDLALSLQALDTGRRAAVLGDIASMWSSHFEPNAVAQSLAVAPIIGAAHEAESYRMIIDGIECEGCDQAGRVELEGLLRFWVNSLFEAAAEA